MRSVWWTVVAVFGVGFAAVAAIAVLFTLVLAH